MAPPRSNLLVFFCGVEGGLLQACKSSKRKPTPSHTLPPPPPSLLQPPLCLLPKPTYTSSYDIEYGDHEDPEGRRTVVGAFSTLDLANGVAKRHARAQARRGEGGLEESKDSNGCHTGNAQIMTDTVDSFEVAIEKVVLDEEDVDEEEQYSDDVQYSDEEEEEESDAEEDEVEVVEVRKAGAAAALTTAPASKKRKS